jgi:hypothetical protein
MALARASIPTTPRASHRIRILGSSRSDRKTAAEAISKAAERVGNSQTGWSPRLLASHACPAMMTTAARNVDPRDSA